MSRAPGSAAGDSAWRAPRRARGVRSCDVRRPQVAQLEVYAAQRIEPEQRDGNEGGDVIGERVRERRGGADAVESERELRRLLEYAGVSRGRRNRDTEAERAL